MGQVQTQVIRGSRPRVVTLQTIQDRINWALRYGYTIFILVVGEKGLGKSSLCLGLLYEIYKRFYPGMEQQIWRATFNHLTFTPRQFYRIYSDAKAAMDRELVSLGLDPEILRLDVETDWLAIVDQILATNITLQDLEEIRMRLRIKGVLVDDIGAHISRHDTSIYWDPYFQHLFADLTLIRPYCSCMLGTAPDITDVPRAILKHVTDIIQAESKGHGTYRIKKRFLRFRGAEVGGYMKLYDQAPVTWYKLPDEQYARYEMLRHLLSRKVTHEADEALAKKALRDM